MSIQPSEMIWTIINFLLLMFLLKVFLFKPLLKFMDAQKSGIKEGLAEGERARRSIEDNERQMAADIRKSNSEAKRILSQAKAADERAKSEILRDANEKAAVIRGASVQRIANEEKAALSRVEESYPELLFVLTGRLLGDEESLSDRAGGRTEAVTATVP